MAQSKKSEFGAKDQKLADFAKAFSHPARVSILRMLARQGTCVCGELVDALPLAQSTVSQHIRELKDANIITGEVEGPKSCYCINWDVLEDQWKAFNSIMQEMETNQAKLCCKT